ncbi:MAG TPA: MupA/Atu3671 family FMN-dependent luciferase-like monooxygenase, partial [Thermoanaerobaculia bacterium]|nr:MupA/Atu3671 family FMN-dependent luciferase-like monooxygenase [Thermoanaerobaculia bacterium]
MSLLDGLTQILCEGAQKCRERVLYVYLSDGEEETGRVTWGELDLAARTIAAHLQALCPPGERALLLYPSGLEFISAFFGCLYAGVVAVPAYPPRGSREHPRLLSMVDDARPRLALTTTALLPRLQAWAGKASFQDAPRWVATDGLDPAAADAWRKPEIRPETLAFLQYTSGSTAVPKGVMVSHDNLLHNEWEIRRVFGQTAESVVVGWLPLYHDMGLIGTVLQPLYSGGQAILMAPTAFLQKPLRWLAAVSRYGADTSGGPNSAYELCVRRIGEEQRAGLDLSRWRVAFNGAEPVRPETLSRFADAFAPCGFRRESFHPCYGLAEATLLVTGAEEAFRTCTLEAQALEEGRVAAARSGSPTRTLVGCGRGWEGQRLAIVDPATGEPVAAGRVGEIWVHGPHVAAGYWENPEETAATFGARLAGEPESYLRTGDLGFLHEGELFVTGRLKDLIILRGRNHYPQDLELTAERSHPALRPGGSAAFSIDHEGEERLVLACELERGAAPPVEEVAGAVRRGVAEEHEVQVFDLVLLRAGTLPRTSSGKVRRRGCRAGYLDGELQIVGRSLMAQDEVVDGEDAPSLETLAGLRTERRAAALTAWVQEVAARACRVPVTALPAERPLAEAGLDSLAAIEVQHAVEAGFGVTLEASELLDQTPVGLGAWIAAALPDDAARPPLAGPAPESSAGAVSPLSHGQRALWFLDRLSPESAAYNLACAARVRGPLDVAALGRACEDLAERHPVLRTLFVSRGGEPGQRIDARLRPDFAVGDASSWMDRELRQRLDTAAGLPFDLEAGPPWRLRLFAVSPVDHALLLVFHHLVSDFWSIVLLLADLEALYLFHTGTRSAPPPAPAATYTGYVHHQRRLLEGPQGERLRAFWERQLAGPLPDLELPADRPRPAVQSFRGAAEPIAVPPAVTAGLQLLAREHGATLFMVLLAAFQVLLHRVSGQDEVLVGTPSSGRRTAGFADVAGYFVNPVVLRADLRDAPAFAVFLGRVRSTVIAALAHQDYPFALLAEGLRPERDPSRSPVFQALLTLYRAQRPELERLASFATGEGGETMDWGGLGFESLRLDWRPAPFDLMLTFAASAGGLAGGLQYAADLFDAVTIRRLLGHLVILLGEVTADARRPAGELPLLSVAERAQLLTEWNDTADDAPREHLVHRQFAAQVRRTPDAVAVVCDNLHLTYGTLDRQADALAGHLRALGLEPEGCVGVCLERDPGLPVALLAILKAGGAYVPLDPAYPREQLDFIIEDAGLVLLVTEERWAGGFPPSRMVVCLEDGRLAAALGTSRSGPPPWTGPDRPDRLAYLIYTSGSTGRPKGVMVGHGQVTGLFAGMDRRLDGEPGRWLAATSISFDISVLELFWTLCRGYQVVVRPGESSAPAAASGRPVDLSLFYFASEEREGGQRDKYRLLLEGARFADEHGFAAVWTPERHFHAFGGLYPNPSVTGAAVAAVTRRVAIRAGSVVLPLHHPIRVAEEWSVVDNISQGRVGISFASGWNAADFVFAPEGYAERRALLREQVETVRRLWRGEPLRCRGGAGEVEVRIMPRPVQPELPVWLTAAASPDTFRLAGELGAGVLTHLLGQDLRDLAGKLALYRQAWGAAGHPGDGHAVLMLHTFVGEDDAAVRETVRQPFKRYLASSLDLMQALVPGQDIAAWPADEREALLERAFERYFATSGLFGTVDACLERVEGLREVGVDEVACLVDFGIGVDQVLASLQLLARLRERLRETPRETARPAEPPLAVSQLILRHGITHFQCTPSAATALLTEPEAPAALGGLEKLLVGGEALPAPLAAGLRELLRGDLLDMYGPTETTVWSASGRVDGAVTLGRPILNTEIHLLDGSLQTVPLGQTGELFIGGLGVVRGYRFRPDLTAARFLPDPFGPRSGGRLYRTGDLGRRLPDGRIVFQGRTDHQVKIRGHRIELGEVEAVLASHPAVREAVVIARDETPEDLAGRLLVAYVVPVTANGPGELGARLTAERIEQVLDGHDRHRLPNGLLVAQLGDAQTSGIYREIFEQEVYLRHGVDLPDGACVLDVGANIGLFTLFVGARSPGARVYAFEPIAPTCRALRANVDLYGLDARVFELGLSDREEEADFTFYPRMAGLSGRFAEDDRETTRAVVARWLADVAADLPQAMPARAQVDELVDGYLASETYRCQLRTLSALLREEAIDRVDLLKIDVEKSELKVLAGIVDEDWPKIRQIAMEVHSRELLDSVSALLSARGYRLGVDEFVPVGEGAEYVFMLYALRPEEPAAVRRPDRPPLLSLPELEAWTRAKLPAVMVPAAFVVLPSLPLTPNGKVDRKALPSPTPFGGSAAVGYVAPRSPAQRAVARVWGELLGLEAVGLRDNFFAVGGNSLRAVQAVSRLRQTLGVEVSLRAFFQNPTVEKLASVVESVQAALPPGEDPIRPARRDADLPLSWSQQRLWFLEQLGVTGAAYAMPAEAPLEGELDVDALRRGLGEVVRRHEVLRTCYPSRGGHPAQWIAPAGPWALPLIDLAELPGESGRAEAARIAAVEARRPLDLAAGPLLRSFLLRLGGREHRLLLLTHHVVADAWSIRLFCREVEELYRAFAAGAPSPLPELSVQYADFAVWQREGLTAEALAAPLAYWRQLLAGAPALLLPADRVRPAVHGFRGAQARAEVNGLADGLAALCRREELTPFMALLGVFQLLLSRHVGQRDVVVGTPVAGRDRLETEPLIGFFVNTLVLRLDLDGDPALAELLRRVRRLTLECYEHRHVPFELLVESLATERTLSHNPLFQVAFSFEALEPEPAVAGTGLRLRPRPLDNGTAKFDLSLWATADGDRLRHSPSTAPTCSTRRPSHVFWSTCGCCSPRPCPTPAGGSPSCRCSAKASGPRCWWSGATAPGRGRPDRWSTSCSRPTPPGAPRPPPWPAARA